MLKAKDPSEIPAANVPVTVNQVAVSTINIPIEGNAVSTPTNVQNNSKTCHIIFTRNVECDKRHVKLL